MKDTAPISSGILAVAALFGLVGGLISYVALGFGGIAAFVIGVIIALIVMLILWLGWRDPAPSLQESNAASKAELEASRTKLDNTSPAPTASSAGTATATASAAAATAATTAAATSTAPASTEPAVKMGNILPGEKDLDDRKGDWKYEAPAQEAPAKPEPAAKPKPAAKKKAAPKKEAAAKTPAQGEDYDGDGIVEGVNEGTRPATLDGPRGGKADNLKEIKGIGPKLEKLCNKLGFYHFDQIANWTSDEVAWVDANLEGFKGRVSRDTWVEQATILAAGGETEFSKKVDKGGVY